MKEITINTSSYGHQIKEYIERRINKLEEKDFVPIISSDKIENVVFVNCRFSDKVSLDKQESYFEEYMVVPLAEAIMDIIHDEFARDYANEVLTTKHDFDEIRIMGVVKNPQKTEQLLSSIVAEIKSEHTLSLDGWIRFRLGDYKTYINQMVDNLIYEYYEYKEYEEFIELLREFVRSREPLEDMVNIIPGSKGKMSLYDSNKQSLIDGYESECDDLILGKLMTLAPRNIIIHNIEYYDNISAINTIINIYGDSVSFCKGCQVCNKPKWYQVIINKFKPPIKK